MNRAEKALSYYSKGYNCAQSVVVSFTDILKIDEEVALKMSSGFGGGMGRMQETCGAATGAFMVIGYLLGKYKESDEGAKENTNELIQEFAKKFTERFGSINCLGLIEYDLNTEKGRQQANRQGVFRKKCTNYVKESVELLEEILKS
mgnify:CR=1 FL=1